MAKGSVLMIYRIFHDSPKYLGIVDKMEGQIMALQNAGFAVDAITLGIDGLYLNNIRQAPRNLKNKLNRYIYYLSNFFRDLEKVIDFKRYDAIYIRHFLVYRAFLHFLKKAKRSNPSLKLVMELPTYPYDLEYRSILEKIALRVDRHYRKKLPQYTDRIVHFGSETEIWNIPCVQIQNGISLPPDIMRTDFTSSPFVLIAVGNLAFWWGLDLLIEEIAQHQNKHTDQNILLRIVGMGQEEQQLREKVTKLGIDDRITFYGYKNGSELEELLLTSHAGIGSLSVERKNLKKTSSLKHRLYAAYGLPFVYRGIDEDFEGVEWVLGLKPEDGLDLKNIISWYNDLQPIQKRFQDIREFARCNLTWDSAFLPFIQYLNQDH